MKEYLIKTICILLLYFGFASGIYSQDKTNDVIFKIADNILNSQNFKFYDKQTEKIFQSTDFIESDSVISILSPYNDWRYWNGVINLAFIELSQFSHNNTYQNYTKQNISFAFDNIKYFKEKHNGENKWSYPFGQLFIMNELDDCGAMGASVIEVYKNDPQNRYKTYLEKAADHITNKQDRLNDGTLVRSFPKKYTIWADDLYMSISFLSRYGQLKKSNSYFDDAAKQVIHFHNYLIDEKHNLMKHNWYSDLEEQGVAFWGRANGWAVLAQIDLLERVPENYIQRDTLINLFRKHINGIVNVQSMNGLWHQLLDKTDSYYETSCSAMFTYAIAKGVSIGILDDEYKEIALLGWEGLKTKITDDGIIEGVCAGTIVYDDLQPYYDRPTPINDIHGIGAVLLAGIEIARLHE